MEGTIGLRAYDDGDTVVLFVDLDNYLDTSHCLSARIPRWRFKALIETMCAEAGLPRPWE